MLNRRFHLIDLVAQLGSTDIKFMARIRGGPTEKDMHNTSA